MLLEASVVTCARVARRSSGIGAPTGLLGKTEEACPQNCGHK